MGTTTIPHFSASVLGKMNVSVLVYSHSLNKEHVSVPVTIMEMSGGLQYIHVMLIIIQQTHFLCTDLPQP
jgi:hypothetical protein